VPCVDPLSLLPAIRRSAWRLHARLPASVDHDDLVQAGMLRVLERQQRTPDDAAGYLLIVARGGMLDFLRAGDPLHHTERLRVRRLAEARDRVERRECRPAGLAEVAAEAGVPIDDAAQDHDVALCGLDEACGRISRPARPMRRASGPVRGPGSGAALPATRRPVARDR
jgi:DNA-directed RNA polymerase specialized sigma24 family protein